MARILAVHRYFHPDVPPYASMLRAIVQRWAADGHHVDVVTGQPSYRESNRPKLPKRLTEGRFTVRRLNLPKESGRSALVRLTNAVRLSAAVAGRLIVGKYDYVMVSTAPPVALAFTTGVVAKLLGTRLIYHCMDLHPEIGKVSGEFANPVVYNTLLRMDTATMRRAWAVVVLSEDMARTVRGRRGADGAQVLIRNNFALPEGDDPEVNSADNSRRAAELWAGLGLPESTFTVLFAGNIGRFQGLDDVLDAMASTVTSTPIHLVLMGDGNCVDTLRLRAEELGVSDRVHFLGLHKVGVARHVMLKADAGLVSLQASLISCAYPSKTATYAEQGLALLAVVEADSSLAQEIRKSGAGVSAEPGNLNDLATALGEVAGLGPDELGRMSDAARDWAHREFAESTALDWWSELVREEA